MIELIKGSAWGQRIISILNAIITKANNYNVGRDMLSVYDGLTHLTIPHGLVDDDGNGVDPSTVLISIYDTTIADSQNYTVTSDETNITITFAVLPATDVTVGWQAFK